MVEVQQFFEFEIEPPKMLQLLSVDEIFDRADQDMLKALSEDRRLERKPAGFHAGPLREYLVMWANTAPDGGIMVMGVTDDGAIEGCGKLSPQSLSRLENPEENCPDARCFTRRVQVTLANGSSDFVVLIRVMYRRGRVAKTLRGEVFVRRGFNKVQLSEVDPIAWTKKQRSEERL